MSNPTRAKRSPKADDGFTFGSGEAYADNAEYAEKALRFDILATEFQPRRGYEGHDRWAVTVQAKGRDHEILTLGANPKRDEELRAAQNHLKRKGAIKNVRLVRTGNAYYFRNENA